MSWDFDSDNTKVEFTKFPVGITKIRVVDEAPYLRWTHWMNTLKRSINCPGNGCPICEIRKNQKANKMPQTHNMSRRFVINVLNRETGKVEIMEQGVGFFEDLRDLMRDLQEDGKSLIDVDIKVRRRGTGKDDTSYRLDLDDEYPLTPEEITLVESAVNLREYFKPHTHEQINRVLNGETWEDVMYAKDEEKEEEITIE